MIINVWNCTFYMMDDDGNELLNDDGTVKIFDAPDYDWSDVAESVEFDDLVELESHQYVELSDLVDPVEKSKKLGCKDSYKFSWYK